MSTYNWIYLPLLVPPRDGRWVRWSTQRARWYCRARFVVFGYCARFGTEYTFLDRLSDLGDVHADVFTGWSNGRCGIRCSPCAQRRAAKHSAAMARPQHADRRSAARSRHTAREATRKALSSFAPKDADGAHLARSPRW